MAACHATVLDADPDQHVAAERLCEPQALAGPGDPRRLGADRSAGQPVDDGIDQAEALLDLADAHPDPRVDIPGGEHRHLESELIVRCIARLLACVEGTPAGAPDVTARGELPH